MQMRISAIFFVILMFSVGQTSAQAPTQEDIISGLTTSEKLIESFAIADWAGLHALLGAQAQLQRTPQDIQTALEPALRVLGPMSNFLMSQEGVTSAGCQQRNYATAHQYGSGKVVVRVCPEDGAFRVMEYAILPDIKAIAHALFPDVLAENLGVSFLYVDCDVEQSLPINEIFECEAIASDGISSTFVLRRTGEAAVSPESYEPLASQIPQMNEQQLAVAAQIILAYFSNRDFDAIHREASLPFRSLINRDSYIRQLEILSEHLGAATETKWLALSEDQGNGLPLVELESTFEKGLTMKVGVRLMPDRGAWRMDGLYFDYPRGSTLDQELVAARLQTRARNITADDSATIRCPMDQVVERTEVVSCSGHAYDRDLDFEVRSLSSIEGAWYDDSMQVSLSDFPTILRARLEKVEGQLGWRVDGLSCGAENHEALTEIRCLVDSPDGDRQLTVLNLGSTVRIIDVRRVAAGQ